MSTPAAVLADLEATLGPQAVIRPGPALDPYLVEWRKLWRGEALAALRPRTTEEVAYIVRHCGAAGIAIVPQSGNTGLVGGGVPDPGTVVVSMERMTAVRAVDPAGFTMTLEAGVVLAEAQRLAREAGRLFPLSLAAEGSARIGGVLSTNAGGTQVLRYGNARDLVLGLEVVLADGTVWNGLKALRKDNTGYDLKHLFLGSEGTLGLITAAVLKLFPANADVATALVAVPDLSATVALLGLMRRDSGDQVSAFEYMNAIGLQMVVRHGPNFTHPLPGHEHYVLIELTSPRTGAGLVEALSAGLERALEDGLVLDALIAQSHSQGQQFWRMREFLPEAQGFEGTSIKHDVSVPIGAIADYCTETEAAVMAAIPGARVVNFGHIGDGNVHFNVSQPVGADGAQFLARWDEVNRIVYDRAMALGGSFSAEHGVGRLKVGDVVRYKCPVEIGLMQRVKAALDPAGLLNPGKVVPSRME
ncbi:MAG: FAD-binding oxidoreductase [Alphaproteobacteria bacterium]|nr:MAG: FAD-binding oxidoreductase [Alphaproteobacteria bacterium]